MKPEVVPVTSIMSARNIMAILNDGPTSPTAIATRLQLTQGYVGNRLSQLKALGLVEVERQGMHAIYCLSKKGRSSILDFLPEDGEEGTGLIPGQHLAPAAASPGRDDAFRGPADPLTQSAAR
jgi:DNA-binding transcriptional ArsR family regulator